MFTAQCTELISRLWRSEELEIKTLCREMKLFPASLHTTWEGPAGGLPFLTYHQLMLTPYYSRVEVIKDYVKRLIDWNIQKGRKHPSFRKLTCVMKKKTCFSAILPNHPPPPSPTESQRLFCTSVSLLLFLIQGYCYHLSKFRIYALVYCIGVFLSGLLHCVYYHIRNALPVQVGCRIQEAWGWCTGMTQRDGMGREEGRGFRMGNMCTPVVDSCWCVAKPIQYCKVIRLQLK